MTDPPILLAAFAAIAVFATIYHRGAALFRGRQARRRASSRSPRARADPRPRACPACRRRQAREPAQRAARRYMRQIVERLQPQEGARRRDHGQPAAHGRLPRSGAAGRVPVRARSSLPLVFFVVALFYLFVVIRARSADLDQDADRRHHRRYVGFYAADPLHQQRHLQAPDVDPARLAGCPRPAAHLRRIRHVRRGRLPQGVRGDRRAVGRRSPKN